MNLKVFRHLWGVEDSLKDAAHRFTALGYQGLEVHVPEGGDINELKNVIRDNKLELIVLLTTPSDVFSVREHLISFRQQLQNAASLEPTLINFHAGIDAWSQAQQGEFYGNALEEIKRLGLRVSFETHRGRPTYQPWNTDRLVSEFPTIQLTLDLSHWVVVCERIINDQLELIKRVADVCVHVHARVGHSEGAQVPDPRSVRYQAELLAHERWWRIIWESQKTRGFTTTTLTPEFGPDPYLQTDLNTGQPVANLVEICEWMTTRQKEQFAIWSSSV